jgi:hypothetical protein
MPTRPRPLDTWLRANLWHEFLDGTDMTFAGLTGANAITFAALLKGDLGRDRRRRDGRDRPQYHPVRDHRLPAQYRRQPSICLDWAHRRHHEVVSGVGARFIVNGADEFRAHVSQRRTSTQRSVLNSGHGELRPWWRRPWCRRRRRWSWWRP